MIEALSVSSALDRAISATLTLFQLLEHAKCLTASGSLHFLVLPPEILFSTFFLASSYPSFRFQLKHVFPWESLSWSRAGWDSSGINSQSTRLFFHYTPSSWKCMRYCCLLSVFPTRLWTPWGQGLVLFSSGTTAPPVNERGAGWRDG